MSNWEPPEDYVLTRHEAHSVNHQGFRIDDATPDHKRTVHPGGMDVFWFDEDEPFVQDVNNGRGPMASPEAKAAAKAGKPITGWSPNGELRPIQGGYVPPQYQLHHKSEAPTEADG